VNRLELVAKIDSISNLRYSPAGIPVLDFMLIHESTVVEADKSRIIQLKLKSIAIGILAEKVCNFQPGSTWFFNGFLSSSQNLKSITYHVQEIHTV
jgi:primosomal replication protein N